MPKVYNRHKEHPFNAVYIGRGTKWGNPYIMGVDGLREGVIMKFKRNLSEELKVAARNELRGKDLLCSCAPLPCHGDILLEIANDESYKR